MSERTDTERLDWILDALFAENSEKLALVAGAILMGKHGRDALDLAINGEVPTGVSMAAMALKK